MEAKDVIQLIVSVFVPVAAVLLAQQTIAKRETTNRAMDLFYDLVSHVEEFRRSFYRSASHCRQYEECLNSYHRAEDLYKREKVSIHPHVIEELERVKGQSVEVGLQIRIAATALKADGLLFKMIFGSEGRDMVATIDSLRQTAQMFEGKNPSYFKECFPVETDMAQRVDRLTNEIYDFWKSHVNRDVLA